VFNLFQTLFNFVRRIVGTITFQLVDLPDQVAAIQAIFNGLVLRIEAAIFFFLVILILYKYLPNKKVRTMDVLPAAILAGIMAQLVQTAYVFALPFMDIRSEYGSQGPFFLPVNVLLLTYCETFVVLGGAFLATHTRSAPWLGNLDDWRSSMAKNPERADDKESDVAGDMNDETRTGQIRSAPDH
jgi:uncharacterized BrkB/YihY/UPF0761 family membrane protein